MKAKTLFERQNGPDSDKICEETQTKEAAGVHPEFKSVPARHETPL